MKKYNIKANRIFTSWRKWAWILTLVVAFGGLYDPRFGLLVLGIIAGLVGTAFLKGRYWCGNFCPHGSLFDSIIFKISRNSKIPKILRSNTVMILFFLWFGARISSKLFMIATNLEGMELLSKVGFVFVSSYWMVLIVGVPLAILFTPRTWCQFCPMGTIQRLSYKLGKALGVAKKTDVKISVASQNLCHSCAKCSRVCPMQLTPYLEFDENNQFSNEKCIKCSTCVENCPANILSLDSEADAKAKTREVEAKHNLTKPEYMATIIEMNYLSEQVLEIVFDLGKNKVNFTPGQFILVRIEEKMNRAYSISGFDKEKNTLRITIKKAPNGYGTELIFDEFKKGKQVVLEGPMGDELIVDKRCEDIILIAGGIGITPFIPILEDLVKDKKYKGNVHLIYGVNQESEILYKEDIEAMIKHHEHIKFIPVVAFDENYKGEKGFVTHVIEKLPLDNAKIYMCGPKPMVDSSKKLLVNKQFDQERLFVETA